MSTATASVVGVFNVVSRVYDSPTLQRLVYRPNQDAVVSALRRAKSQRVLDVGCGTGILATRIEHELSPEVVYGCDPSEGMLEKARERSAAVRWLQGAAEELPFDDGALDAVTTTEAFQFFDKPAALADFHRVLEPGGQLVIAVLTPRVALPRAPIRLGPASWLTPRQLRELAEQIGFRVIEQRSVRPLLGPLSPGVATVAVKQ